MSMLFTGNYGCPDLSIVFFFRRLFLCPFQEAFQLPAAARVLELADGLGLDLADPLSRQAESFADLFESVGLPVSDSEAELQDLLLRIAQCVEHLVDAILEHFL